MFGRILIMFRLPIILTITLLIGTSTKVLGQSDSLLFAQHEMLIEIAESSYSSGDFILAGEYYDSAFSIFPYSYRDPFWVNLFNAMCTFSLAGETTKALFYLDKYVMTDESRYSPLMLDPDLESLRKSKEFRSKVEPLRKPGIIYPVDIVEDVANTTEKFVVYRNKEVVLYFPDLTTLSGKPFFYFNNDTVTVSFVGCTIYNPNINNVNLGTLYFLNCKIEGSMFEINEVKLSNLDFKLTQVPNLYISNSTIDNIYYWENTMSTFSNSDLSFLDIKIQGSLSIKDCNFRFPKSKWTDYYEGYNLPKDLTFTYDNDFLYRQVIDVKSSSLTIKNSTFSSVNDYQTALFYGGGTEFTIANSRFDMPLEIKSVISDNFRIEDSEFDEYVILEQAVFPEFNTYIPIRQFKKGMGLFVDIPADAFDEGNGCERCALYTGRKEYELEQVKNFELLLYQYQYLYNNYRLRGELESANTAYVATKDLVLRRLGNVYRAKGGLRNYLRYMLAKIMKIYTNHGTDPILAIVISFYLTLAFSIFYFFFPSEWDKTSKIKLIKDYRNFIQKNEHGYFRPFFTMLAGFLLSLVNALTLSLNAFVTLGFGTIPTTGIARYVCIVQGFIGWFLLSLFTVALINQVLA